MTVNPPREYPRSRGVVPWVWEWFSPQSVYSACLDCKLTANQLGKSGILGAMCKPRT